MLIDNFSPSLLPELCCPASLEPLEVHEEGLISSTGLLYRQGDFRLAFGETLDSDWDEGQTHYLKYHQNWISEKSDFFKEVDRETQEIYERITLPGKILDIGGGFATVVKQASIDPARLYSVDPMVCRWNDLPDGEFKRHYGVCCDVVRVPGYAEGLPFVSNHFDTVHMRSCLDHFSNPHRALLEARRVLTSQGKLVVGLSLSGSYKKGKIRLINGLKGAIKQSPIAKVYERLFDHHAFHPTEKSLICLIESAGFRVTDFIYQEGYEAVIYISAVSEQMPFETYHS